MATAERNVAIVGAGLIGRAWAAIFARAGWNVRLTDPHVATLKAAPRLIRDELHMLAQPRPRRRSRWRRRPRLRGRQSRGSRSRRRIRPGERAGKDRGQAGRFSPSSTSWRQRTRCWSPRHRPSPPRASPRTCPAGRAAWSAIPSTRRIWCRWSNFAARRGPRRKRSSVRAPSIARSGRFRSRSTKRSTALC